MIFLILFTITHLTLWFILFNYINFSKYSAFACGVLFSFITDIVKIFLKLEGVI
jgi:biotin transporter BioY